MSLPLSPAGRRYGWIPSVTPLSTDPAHYFHVPPIHADVAALPAQVDLRPKFAAIPVYDQGATDSCTANAWAGLVAYLRSHAKLPNQWTPSRLLIYYNERIVDGDVGSDGGAQLMSGAASLAIQGVCNEVLWPFDPSQITVQPPASVYAAAKPHKISQAQLLYNSALQPLKSCLALGLPFVAGIQVYESFESAPIMASGDVPMPNTAIEKLLGGHACVVVGYDNATQRFIFRNSWGPTFGQSGYGTLPYGYLVGSGLGSDYHMAHGST